MSDKHLQYMTRSAYDQLCFGYLYYAKRDHDSTKLFVEMVKREQKYVQMVRDLKARLYDLEENERKRNTS